MDGSQSLPNVAVDQHQLVVADDAFSASNIKSWIHDILDWTVKLLPVIATVLVAVVADHYKSSLTAATLLSEREKADSQLRSEMFSKLVDPIAGPKSGGDVPWDREQLLAELLSLNFHEHIGLRPLLSHVDSRIAREQELKTGNELLALQRGRASLRSVAKTVISRQTAMLTRGNETGADHDGAAVEKLDVGTQAANSNFAADLAGEKVRPVVLAGDPISVTNPAQTHRLFLRVLKADWKNETFQIEVSIWERNGVEDRELAKREFELSWFDFPFTDNTLLADGTRFALVLDSVYDATKRFRVAWKEQPSEDAARRVQINVVWFPKDFIAAYERPINLREFRKSLGFTK